MFEPGHLHITRSALQKTDHSFDIHIRYQRIEDPAQGTRMSFAMDGEINGKAFSETFELPRDLAFNFAHDASRIAMGAGGLQRGRLAPHALRSLKPCLEQRHRDIRELTPAFLQIASSGLTVVLKQLPPDTDQQGGRHEHERQKQRNDTARRT